MDRQMTCPTGYSAQKSEKASQIGLHKGDSETILK